MHIAVTGAVGRIGRYVVRDLLAAGHSVQGIDAVAGSGLQVDLTDAGQVYGALAGAAGRALGYLPRPPPPRPPPPPRASLTHAHTVSVPRAAT